MVFYFAHTSKRGFTPYILFDNVPDQFIKCDSVKSLGCHL